MFSPVGARAVAMGAHLGALRPAVPLAAGLPAELLPGILVPNQ
jgi:hypothetical protein